MGSRLLQLAETGPRNVGNEQLLFIVSQAITCFAPTKRAKESKTAWMNIANAYPTGYSVPVSVHFTFMSCTYDATWND